MAPATQGFVYFVTDGDAVKIGFAINPFKRLQELQVSHHRVLRMIGTISAPDYQERMLHNRFRHLRIRGEWFRLEDDILDFVRDCGDDGLIVSFRDHQLNDRVDRIEARRTERERTKNER